jgi:hypothetical protein
LVVLSTIRLDKFLQKCELADIATKEFKMAKKAAKKTNKKRTRSHIRKLMFETCVLTPKPEHL